MVRYLGFAALPAVLLAALIPVRADTAADAYGAMGIKAADVLSGSVVAARVLPGEAKQVVAMVTYFTGKKDDASAVDVRLEVFRKDGNALVEVYSRDFGNENGGFVGRGDLELLDLDGDGVSEIVVSYDQLSNPLVQRRSGEVIVHEPSGFRVAWTGDLEYDATRAARDVPQDRRDRFVRKLDPGATIRTHGITLFMTKKVIAVAGERLPEPKEVKETFPLRPAPAP
ncbi:MAG: hypothetical protein LAO51_08000 [Acidobacteriia bacterium]|nr:hypothetical protein [Terriglobia bacterium]